MSEEILKEKKDTLTINMQSLDHIKKYFFKNSFTSVFTLLAFFSLVFFAAKTFNFSLGLEFLKQITNLFSPALWFVLFISLAVSSILAYYKKYKLMFIPILIWLLFTTAIVRTSNIDGLLNAATGEPVLGPDLDPYLFVRHAQEIAEGRLENPDMMRLTPLGTENYALNNMMPWAIFYVYKIANIFTEYSVTEAAIIAPVIFFLISLVGFFLFVYTLFSFKLPMKKALTGATIAGFLYAFVPAMLHRTIAGVPELESLGMAWFWLAFLFFALAWKQDFISSRNVKNLIKKNKKMIIYGLLAGLFTGAMAWTWGGYKYIYMVLGLASFFAFLFNAEKKKNLVVLGSFLITGLIIEFIKSKSISTVITNFTDTGLALSVLLMLGINFILFRTKLKNNKLLKKIKTKTRLPDNLISILIFIVLGFLFLFIIKPDFIMNIIPRIVNNLLYPFGRGRVGLTVAENRAPYFKEVLREFGNLIWLFLAGIVLIFYEATKHFSPKKKLALNFFFILFVAASVFSRISSQHLLNGENLISKVFYLGGIIVFGSVLIFLYISSYLKKDKKTLSDFSKISFASLILISFSFLGIISMRGAVRLFFIIAPIIIMASSYFVIRIFDYRKSKDELVRLFAWLLIVGAIIIAGMTFVSYAHSTITTSPKAVPDAYYQQWHYAMNWVSENTPKESAFAHWWDYGYWVQTLGKRATIADGGQPGGAERNHFIGRYILTAQEPLTALNTLKTFGATHLLIDSTDLGKYSAFSSIGSDKTGKDRRSWIPIMPINSAQTQEIDNKTKVLFEGGAVLDENIIYTDSKGKQIFLPEGKAGLGAIILEYKEKNKEVSFSQPIGVFFYNNQRYDLPLRYLYYEGKMIDFKTGIEPIARIIPSLSQTSQGVSINQIGAVIYLSEKTRDSLLAQLYLLDDVNNEYPTVEVAHVEDDFVVKSLKQQGLDLGDFIYYQGLRGPIKIWKVNYPSEAQIHEEYLEWQNLEEENSWGKLDYLGV